ncbi:MAG TPA: hypothetical protein VKF35_20395 [Hyphomicrobiaceae bacterium]|nr:hypothetical protein [Hyphomicrobiaceae bacterium]
MPTARVTEAFVWKRATPSRGRLIGAIAIGLSSGCLGFVLARALPSERPATNPSRTAALIAGVAKETRAQGAQPPAGGEPRQSGSGVQPATTPPAAAPVPGDGQTPRSVSAITAAAVPPHTDPNPADLKPAAPNPAAASAEASGRQQDTERPSATPPEPDPARRLLQPPPPAADARERQPRAAAADVSAAPNYQALREEVLGR